MVATYTQLLRELLKERADLYATLCMERPDDEDKDKWSHLQDCCADIMEDLYDDMTDEHGNLI